MSITQNTARVGSFTSSGISALMTTGKQAEGFGVAAITYINEKRMERLLGRSLTDEVNAKPLAWGKLLEKRVHDLLPIAYTFSSDVTDVHSRIPYWAGSKDGTHEGAEKAVIDIKCPITLKSFCQLVMPLYCGMSGNEAIKAIREGFTYEGVSYEKHKQAEDYYWQLVSNACINNVNYAELIVYMPYYSEINDIRLSADGNPDAYRIAFSSDTELPHLVDGGFFKNINIIRFEVPETDKALLEANVLKAGKLLGVSEGILLTPQPDGITIAEALK